jgi:hypothetical protein
MLAADYVFCAAILIVIGCNLYFGPKIKGERIAMQWGVDGKPTWTAPKQIGLWWMVPFMLAVRLFIWAASTYVPARVHGGDAGINRFVRHSRGCASLRFDGGQEGKLKRTPRPAGVVQRQT